MYQTANILKFAALCGYRFPESACWRFNHTVSHQSLCSNAWSSVGAGLITPSHVTAMEHPTFCADIPDRGSPPWTTASKRKMHLLLVLVFGTLATLGCQENALTEDTAIETVSDVELVQIHDGTALTEQALAFRAAVGEWRQADFTTSPNYNGEELAYELSNTFGMLWSNASLQLWHQEVIFDSILVDRTDSYGPVESLAAYEEVKEKVYGTLRTYSANGGGFRWIYVTPPVEHPTGMYLHLYAEVCDMGSLSTLNNRTGDQIWAGEPEDAGALCGNQTRNDNFIQTTQNIALGNRVTVSANGQATTTGKFCETRTQIIGSAVIAQYQGSFPASDAQLDLPLTRFARSQVNQDFPNLLTPCSFPETFQNAGQYLVHYDCNSNEVCFNSTKASQYSADHAFLGDGKVFRLWKDKKAELGQFVGSDVTRVGAYVNNAYLKVNNGQSKFRSHVAKFFYGAYFCQSVGPSPGPVVEP